MGNGRCEAIDLLIVSIRGRQAAYERNDGRSADRAASDHLLKVRGSRTQHNTLQRCRFSINRVRITADARCGQHRDKTDKVTAR